ncbi:MFS transporter [Subtercola boreus]|uniref:MFS transporter n=1 Tax=Subtercola boreus TaxID=120213 RepID=A0A3E0VK17_9MICO|nr:MFS transporter [Subtercola boreus]RFA10226.1 MFS transporter [Subtercola boreus]TQL52598.1 putative MFS family arabinose efflux permease [Subtercola boreus]
MTNIEQSYAARRFDGRLVLLAIGLFVVGTNAFVIAGLLPAIASTLGVDASDVSYSITFYAIVVAVAAPAVAILLPRLSRTTLMAAGLGLIALGTVLAAASTTLPLFTAGRILAALGGAALVPAATAAAASLSTPAARGRAIAFVSLGFTAATALGSPLGTALGAVGGWQLPLLIVAGIAAVLAVAVALLVRGIPVGHPVSMRARFAPLADHRIVLSLAATLFLTAGFNVVYIFSSSITAGATGGAGGLLALLLLVYGVAGTGGNLVSGRLTDRLGSRRTATIALAVHAAALIALPVIDANYLTTAIVFAVWGFAAFAAAPAVQHRMITIDPAASGLALSWYTTAMYAGIGIAPPLGAAALSFGGAQSVPLAGAAAVVLALGLFQLGYLVKRGRALAPTAPEGALAS